MASWSISDFAGRTSFHGIVDLYDSRKNKLLVLAQYSIAPNTVIVHYVSRTREYTPATFQSPDILVCPGTTINETIVKAWKCGRYSVLDKFLHFSYSDPLKMVQLLKYDSIITMIYGTTMKRINRCLASRNMSYEEAFWSSVYRNTDLVHQEHDNHRLLTKHGSCVLLELKEKENIMNGVKGYVEAEFNVFEYDFLPNSKEHLIWITFNRAFNVPVIQMKAGSDIYLTVRQSCYSFRPNSLTLPNCNDNKSVRYSECLGECVFGYSMRMCQCRLVDAYVYNKTMHLPICNFLSMMKCFSSFEVSEEATKARYNKCHSRCKPCRFCTADVTSTHTTQKFSRPALRIRPSLDYTLIEEIPSKTWEQFIAEIGGQLSLWIGGSILSIVQLVVFGVRYFYHKGVSLNQRNKVESIQIAL